MSLLSHTARFGTGEYQDPYNRHEKQAEDDDIYCRDMVYGSDRRSRFRANEYPETPEDNPRGDELTFSTWMHFRACKDKIISPNEALFLVNYFFEHLNPMNQILSDYYRDPKNHLEMLREDPMLVCTIIAIAARYCRLPGHASRTRGTLVHNTLFRHIQNCVSRVVWGIAEEDMGVGHAISFIESLLLLINWHPRTLNLMIETNEFAPPTDFETVAHGKYFFESSVRGIHAHVISRLSRQSNRMTWMLVGICSTMAQEIGLFDPDALPRVISAPQDERKLRLKKHILLHCVDAHVRVGKGTALQQPFGLSFDVQQADTVLDLDEKDKYVHQSLNCGLEICQLIHMATMSLYQNPAQTRSMITTRKYVSTIAHFDTMFENWHSKAQNIPSPMPTFTAQTEIMYNSGRCFIHLIAVQAIMERSLPLSYQNAQSDQPRVFDESITAEVMNLPETARDLDLIKVIATCCRRTMETVIALHRKDAFRTTTDTIRQHVIANVIFALKVAGLNIEPKSDMIQLLKQVVDILEVSAVDDIDLGPIYADTLRTLIAKVENARPVRGKASGPPADQTSTDQQTSASTTSGGYPANTTVLPTSHSSTNTSSSSRTAANMPALADTAFAQSISAGGCPSAANMSSFGYSGNGAGGFDDPTTTTAMDTDAVGGEPADWSQWLAFQFDPSFSAFEMGYMVDATNPFV